MRSTLIDVVGLYGNIPHDEGIECMKQALNTRADQTISTMFLISLLTQALKFNVFEFDLKLFIQKIGTAMGTRLAPVFANIFMAMIDRLILAIDKFRLSIAFYKRFIDDIFMIWTGTEREFLDFMAEINKLHKTIKFTCSYDFTNKSTIFLDTTVTIWEDGSITTDLFRKPTDRVQYLLPTSCHPSHTFKSIPFSLALRLIRIVSEKDQLEIRLTELKDMLVSRNYNKNIVVAAIEKAKLIPREKALERVVKAKNNRVMFTVTYNPKLPSISRIIIKHWRTMTKDKKIVEHV